MRRIGRLFPWLALVSLLIPTVAGLRAARLHLEGRPEGYIWGGLVRIFFVHHVTWSVNSICHIFGRRRFDIEDKSTNVWWLAPFSLGESWHHNHHAFPRSAFHGLKWYELDPSGIYPRDGEARTGVERDQDRARAPAGEDARSRRALTPFSPGAMHETPVIPATRRVGGNRRVAGPMRRLAARSASSLACTGRLGVIRLLDHWPPTSDSVGTDQRQVGGAEPVAGASRAGARTDRSAAGG